MATLSLAPDREVLPLEVVRYLGNLHRSPFSGTGCDAKQDLPRAIAARFRRVAGEFVRGEMAAPALSQALCCPRGRTPLFNLKIAMLAA